MFRSLLVSGALLLVAGSALAADPPVSGTFKGNGKAAALKFFSAKRGKPFNDKPSIDLIFTEKDHTKDKDAARKAPFGDYGSAIVMSVYEDGGIFGCQIAHQAHTKGAFSSIGTIKMSDFKFADGQVQGKFSSGGEDDFFGQTWEVDIKFAGKFVESATPAPPKTATTPAKPAPSKPTTPTIPSIPTKPAPARPAAEVSASDVPLPTGATGVEYKALVGHIVCQAPTDVKTTTTALAKALDAKGWKPDSPDVITGFSGVLNRKNGAAEIRVIITASGKASKVQYFTEGVKFDEKK